MYSTRWIVDVSKRITKIPNSKLNEGMESICVAERIYLLYQSENIGLLMELKSSINMYVDRNHLPVYTKASMTLKNCATFCYSCLSVPSVQHNYTFLIMCEYFRRSLFFKLYFNLGSIIVNIIILESKNYLKV